MRSNRFNLRNVAVVAICFVGLMAFVGCENKDNPAEENSIVGKWADANFLGTRFIVFTENLRVEQYFHFYSRPLDFVAYSISENSITFTAHFSEPIEESISETFEFILNGSYLTIKLFSSPFSDDTGGRNDVQFRRIQ